MNSLKILVLLLGMTALISACQQDGPAERAGKALDEATSDAGNAIEDACEGIKEGVGADDTDC